MGFSVELSFFKTYSLDKITMGKVLTKTTNSTTRGHNQGKLARMCKVVCKKLHIGCRIMSRNLHGADPMRCPASDVSWWEKRQEDSDSGKTEGKLATSWKKFTALVQGGLTTACHHILTSNCKC